MFVEQITFLIGNGFDINCGLKTQYKDIYKSYTSAEPSSPVVETFQNGLKQFLNSDGDPLWNHWSDFEMGLAEYAKSLQSEEQLLECLEDFTQHMKKHIQNEEQAFFRLIWGNSSLANKAEKEAEESIIHFYEKLPRNNSVQLFSSADTSDKIYFNFVSFNYTKTLDLLISMINRDRTSAKDATNVKAPVFFRDPIHIHGTLSNGLILGIDNKNQLSDIPYQLSQVGEYALIKPVFNDVFDKHRVQSAINAIERSSLICIYGMSLGDSDLTWRKTIKAWLKQSPSHHLVVFYHKYSILENLLSWRMISVERSATVEIMNLLGFAPEEFPVIEQQIHIPIGKNIFNIGSVIQAQVDSEEGNTSRSTGSRR